MKFFIGRNKLLCISAAALAFAAAAYLLTARVPGFTEKVYSGFIYRCLMIPFSSLTGILPFSLGEMLLAALPILVLVLLALSIIASVRAVRSSRARADKPIRTAGAALLPFARFLGRVASIAFIIIAALILLWGLNYNRQPLSVILGLDVKSRPVSELITLTETLAARANALSAEIMADDENAMVLENSRRSYLAKGVDGYDAMAASIPAIGGHYGTPKPVVMSRAMCYAGITGIYSPWTGEGNINMMNPLPDYLFTICHEMAHQRGFAREDECNYIAFLTCSANPDPQFRYAAAYCTLEYALSQLDTYSKSDHDRIFATLDSRITSDMYRTWQFWKGFEGPVANISQKINDTYLKINRQYDGVYSYGRVIDLLLAAQADGSL